MTTVRPRIAPGAACLALLLAAALVTAVYRVTHVERSLIPLAALGWSLDTCVWAWLWFGAHAASADRDTWPARLIRLALLPCLAFLFALSIAYTFFFETALERRFSLLDVKTDGIGYFFEHVLPAEGLWMLSGLFILVLGLTLYLRRMTPLPRTRHAFMALVAMSLVTGLAIAQKGQAASPFADTFADALEIARTPAVFASPTRRHALRALSRERPLANFETAFDKVLIFVLESETAQNLERERRSLPKTTFLNAAASHLHSHTRYYPGNQDSRTGMLGMLVPHVNPQEAYTDADVARYAPLARRTSLVHHMRALGYETAFAISQVETELVVRDLPWQHILHLTDATREAADRRYECLNPYEFEHSCEDLALLPDVLAFLDTHPRAFLYQEFIWGHAWAYNEALGQSNAQYYSSYIDAVLAHLAARGELDRTLVVMVSDHGLRERERLTDPEAYRIPLWFYATGLQPREDTRLLSHLDFADLLFTHMGDTSARPAENPFVLMTGPTHSSLWAAITADHDFMLLKSRGERQLLLHQANVRDPARPSPLFDRTAPAAMARLRADALAAFAPR